jgi:hypothetical protein
LEIDNTFDLTISQREEIEYLLSVATSPGEPEWTYKEFYEKAGLNKSKIQEQPLEHEGNLSQDGYPDGGYCEGPGLSIRWQRGPIDHEESPWNGCFVVTVLQAAKHQLEFYQSTEFACIENMMALDDVNRAIARLTEIKRSGFVEGSRRGHDKGE